MRIISGEYRRRRLHSLPKGVETRPIPDMVKEAMFNLLRGHFEDVGVIDVFSGSGSVGLEMASQGASRVVCVERDRRMVRTLQDNIEMLGCEDRVEVAPCDALGPATLARCPKPAHIVFMDPPYPMVRDREDWVRVKKQFERLIQMLDDTGYAIIRTPWPFYHRELIEDETETELDLAPETDAKKDSKESKPKKNTVEVIDGEEMVEIDGDWIDAWESESTVVNDGGKPKYRTFDISLEMEGAYGPETHAYGSTAIHLYMRKTGDDAESGSDS
ncbi:MAG: RsmD family RNA methyltransferase [Phycisphaerales bacterium]